MEPIRKDRISLPCMLTCAYIIFMPLSIVPLPFGFSLLKLVSYILGVVLIGYLFIGHKSLKFNSVHFFLALYLVYTSTSLLHFIDDNSWVNIRGLFETSLIMFLITIRIYTPKEKALMLKSWMAVGVITAVMSLLGSVDISGERSSLLFLGGIEDPNQLCGYFILPLLLYMKEITKKNRLMPFYILLIIVISYIVFKTGSRGGLIAIIIPVFIYALISVKSFKNILKIIFSFTVIALVFAYMIYPLLPEDVRARYTVESVKEDEGSGRFTIWETTYESITANDSSIIFGRGIGSTVRILLDAGIKNTVAHNHWLQLWSDQGIIGLMLFAIIIFACCLRTFRQQPEITVALFGMLALSMSLTLYASYKPFWNVILMASLNSWEDIYENKRCSSGTQHGEAVDEMH